MNDIEYKVSNWVFNLRVCCILKNRDGHILFQKKKTDNNDQWSLPGGRVKFGESSQKAIVREMKEEFSVDVEGCKLVNIVEQYFVIVDNRYHQILFIFDIKEIHSDVTCIDDSLDYCWFDNLDSKNIKPECLRYLSSKPNVNHSENYFDN